MRTRLIFSVLTTLILLLISAHPATAQLPNRRPSQVTIPKSSQEVPADVGNRFHTNIQILGTGTMLPTGQLSPQTVGPPFPGYFYETRRRWPASTTWFINRDVRAIRMW